MPPTVTGACGTLASGTSTKTVYMHASYLFNVPRFQKLPVLQVAFAVVALVCASYVVSRNGLLALSPINFSIFCAVLSLLVSGLYIFTSPYVKAVHVPARVSDALPGLLDVCVSGTLTLFFLAAGGSVASLGTCNLSGPATSMSSAEWAAYVRTLNAASGRRMLLASSSTSLCG